MLAEPKVGIKVRNNLKPEWGLGKIVYGDSSLAVVYFKGVEGDTPEKKLREFRWPASSLLIQDDEADLELDNLPPYENGKFKRSHTSLTLKVAKDLFLRAYSKGFDDPGYHDTHGERGYKLAAHKRFAAATSSGLSNLIQRPTDLRSTLWTVYYGSKGTDIPPLNLMHPRFEAPIFFEALEDEDWASRYLKVALGFCDAPSETSFSAYAAVLLEMPRKAGTLVGKWPYLTWLPFIADPSKHMMIRPSVTAGFASAAGFDIRYDSEANWRTYERVMLMSKTLLERPEIRGLSISGRALDMIDLQSFEWVAQRYFQPSALDEG